MLGVCLGFTAQQQIWLFRAKRYNGKTVCVKVRHEETKMKKARKNGKYKERRWILFYSRIQLRHMYRHSHVVNHTVYDKVVNSICVFNLYHYFFKNIGTNRYGRFGSLSPNIETSR